MTKVSGTLPRDVRLSVAELDRARVEGASRAWAAEYGRPEPPNCVLRAGDSARNAAIAANEFLGWFDKTFTTEKLT